MSDRLSLTSSSPSLLSPSRSVEGWHFVPKAQNDGVVVRTGDESKRGVAPFGDGVVILFAVAVVFNSALLIPNWTNPRQPLVAHPLFSPFLFPAFPNHYPLITIHSLFLSPLLCKAYGSPISTDRKSLLLADLSC
jgi:hypothetical protein